MSYLSLLLGIPLFGMGIIFLLSPRQYTLIRRIALLHSGLALGLAGWLWFLFDTTVATLQFVEHLQWNTHLGTSYALGIDGFSYPMVLLTALLCFVSLLASKGVRRPIKGYYMLMLVLETATLGVFMARDWAIFYLFWEVTLIPLFFLINFWGGPNRHGASINFMLYTLGGSVFMLISLLVLFDASPNRSFEMSAIALGAKTLPLDTQILVFLGFLIGFGVKMPVFPIHGWLPLAHVEAPSPVSILLSGILLKMGAYGLIRISGTLPTAALAFQDMLYALALIGLIYGGLLAWRQRDLKRMIAYASVSHMGVVLMGIASFNLIGMTGAVLQMVAHGLVAGSLFLLIGLLYERTHTRDIGDYSSLVLITPRFALFTVLALVAGTGLPGTAGFIAELHTLIGGFQQWGWSASILALGVIISAAYALRTIGRLFTGPVRPSIRNIDDLRPHELIAVGTLAVSIIVIGIYPAPTVSLFTASVTQFSTLFIQ
ncbi:MAG: NADH-quinone oxidoreductase subunit M [Magnetococcales bacterium]|nr:NADH-quinone oxidoreductase subunit M [Magnetococcales bacterium]